MKLILITATCAAIGIVASAASLGSGTDQPRGDERPADTASFAPASRNQ
jgi:hypothetical protein